MSKDKPPRDDRELVRDMDDRIDKVERSSATRVGKWVLSTSPDTGNLIASYVDGGSVVLAPPPPDGQKPDEEVDQSAAVLRARRLEDQSLKTGDNRLVAFDKLDAQNGGWRQSNRIDPGDDTYTSFLTPEDNLYLINVKVVFHSKSTRTRTVALSVDDIWTDTKEVRSSSSAYKTVYITAVKFLPAGSRIEVSVRVYTNESIGGEAGASGDSVTSLDVVGLRDGAVSKEAL